MRIQHNIPAMNALTHYTNNNSALAKNLEKLSSGYRINSAADDAAGLAISEKMRSQIAGLEKAYDNTNDGISLVQTAEGALTEVNSMLTRLKTLATQSANGTYQQEVDREAIQQETNDILSEIDRISQATNFNGINLLDGSLGGGSSATGSVSFNAGATDALAATISETKAVAGVYKFTAPTSANAANNNTYEITFAYTDNAGNQQTKTASYTAVDVTNGKFIDNSTGKEITLTGSTTNQHLLDRAMSDFASDKDIQANFSSVTSSSGAVQITAKDAGTSGASVDAISINTKDASGAVTTTTGITTATGGTTPIDSYTTMNLSKATVWDGQEKTLADSIFEVNGEKFVFIANGTTLSDKQKTMLSDAGVGNNYRILAAAGSPAAADVTDMANKIAAATGLAVEQGAIDTTAGATLGSWKKAGATPAATDVLIGIKGAAASNSSSSGKGLVLQVGDTNDDFQKVSVSIDDMSSKGIGIAGLDLSSQDAAGNAIDTIKEAVNIVSAQRGKLGALQNRLDHTLNNLDAMTENITSSEAQIRDTNMAKEMTAYTKNNILAQAAQSMLAQANSMPQGVLQLLQ